MHLVCTLLDLPQQIQGLSGQTVFHCGIEQQSLDIQQKIEVWNGRKRCSFVFSGLEVAHTHQKK